MNLGISMVFVSDMMIIIKIDTEGRGLVYSQRRVDDAGDFLDEGKHCAEDLCLAELAEDFCLGDAWGGLAYHHKIIALSGYYNAVERALHKEGFFLRDATVETVAHEDFYLIF